MRTQSIGSAHLCHSLVRGCSCRCSPPELPNPNRRLPKKLHWWPSSSPEGISHPVELPGHCFVPFPLLRPTLISLHPRRNYTEHVRMSFSISLTLFPFTPSPSLRSPGSSTDLSFSSSSYISFLYPHPGPRSSCLLFIAFLFFLFLFPFFFRLSFFFLFSSKWCISSKAFFFFPLFSLFPFFFSPFFFFVSASIRSPFFFFSQFIFFLLLFFRFLILLPLIHLWTSRSSSIFFFFYIPLFSSLPICFFLFFHSFQFDIKTRLNCISYPHRRSIRVGGRFAFVVGFLSSLQLISSSFSLDFIIIPFHIFLFTVTYNMCSSVICFQLYHTLFIRFR